MQVDQMSSRRDQMGWYVIAACRMAINLPILVPYWLICR